MINKEKKTNQTIAPIAKRVIHLFVLGKDEWTHTMINDRNSPFYSLVRSRPCHLLKFPGLPNKLRFFGITNIDPKNSDKISHTQKTMSFLKQDLKAFKEGSEKDPQVSHSVETAFTVDQWSTTMKHFYVLVGQLKNDEGKKLVKRLKNWKLLKDLDIEKLLDSLEKKGSNLKNSDISLVPLNIENHEEEEVIKHWNDMIAQNEERHFQITRVIRYLTD